MPSVELFGLARRFTVARLLERDDFTQPDGGRRSRSRCSSCSTRCSRATTRSRSRPTSSSAGPSSGSTCSSAATSRRSFGQRPQVVMTDADPARHRRGPEDEQVARQLRRRDRAGGRDLRQADERPRRRADHSTGSCCSASRSTTARHPIEAKRDLARRICDRFAGAGSGAEAEARFNQVHQDREDPRRHPRASARRSARTSTCRPCSATAFGRQRQRGPAPDRPGSRPDRRRAGRRGSPRRARRRARR